MEQIITKIETVRNSRKRKIYINDSLLFSLYPAEVRQYDLKEEDILTPEKYQELCTEVFCPRAKRRAMNLLVTKDRSRKELEEKLKGDGYPEEAVAAALSYVESYHYLDDLRFSVSLIRSKQEEKSSRQIQMKLREKGISREVSELAFETVEEERMELMGDDYEPAELEAIRRAVRRKTSEPASLDEKAKLKLLTSLYNKGFCISDIREIMNTDVSVMD